MSGTSKKTISLSCEGRVKAPNGRIMAYGEIARRSASAIRGHGYYKNFEPAPQAVLCVQIAEVELDVDTGQVSIKQFTTAHSTGIVLNPLMHQAQIACGSVMGIGYAMMEELLIEGSNVVSTNF